MPGEYSIDQKPGSPFLSALFSFILPGAGQLYNKEYRRGLIMLIIALTLIATTLYFELTYQKEYKMMLRVENNNIAVAMEYAAGKVPYRHFPLIPYIAMIFFCAFDAYRFMSHLIKCGFYDPSLVDKVVKYEDIFED